jgi:hypothetical protein
LKRKEGPFIVFKEVNIIDIKVAKYGGENAHNYNLIVKILMLVKGLKEQGYKLLLKLEEVEVI